MKKHRRTVVLVVSLVLVLNMAVAAVMLLSPFTPRPLFFEGPVLNDRLPYRIWVPVPPNVDDRGTIAWFDETLNTAVLMKLTAVAGAGTVSSLMFERGDVDLRPNRAVFSSESGSLTVTAEERDTLIISAGKSVLRVRLRAGAVRRLRDAVKSSGSGRNLDAILSDISLSDKDREELERLRADLGEPGGR